MNMIRWFKAIAPDRIKVFTVIVNVRGFQVKLVQKREAFYPEKVKDYLYIELIFVAPVPVFLVQFLKRLYLAHSGLSV